MAPVLAEHFQALAVLLPRSTQPGEVSQAISRRLNALFAGVILLMVLITLPWFKEGLPLPELKRGLISAETPVEATQFLLDNRLPGPIFHHMAYGSYLIWAAQPDYPVFVDPRIELYPYSYWIDYIFCDIDEIVRSAKWGKINPVLQNREIETKICVQYYPEGIYWSD
jgi:hypothetical protein